MRTLPAVRERRGDKVSAVLRLQYSEPVRLDMGQLEVLNSNLGPASADQVINQALEEVATALGRISRQYREGEIKALRGAVRALVAVAQQLGMTTLARVGRDVLELSEGFDGAAFGAAVARLERCGERSLIALWDLQDLSI